MLFVSSTFPLNASNSPKTPLSIKILIDFLLRAKWTKAKVLYYFTIVSYVLSLQSAITRSITPLFMISSNKFSLYVNKDIARTAFDLIELL